MATTTAFSCTMMRSTEETVRGGVEEAAAGVLGQVFGRARHNSSSRSKHAIGILSAASHVRTRLPSNGKLARGRSRGKWSLSPAKPNYGVDLVL